MSTIDVPETFADRSREHVRGRVLNLLVDELADCRDVRVVEDERVRQLDVGQYGQDSVPDGNRGPLGY